MIWVILQGYELDYNSIKVNKCKETKIMPAKDMQDIGKGWKVTTEVGIYYRNILPIS